MNSYQISQKITRVLLVLVFFSISGFSIYLSNELTWPILFFAIMKGVVGVIFAWLFFLILSDAIVKSVMTSVANMQEKRRLGGLLFHFIKPAENEILPEVEKKSNKDKKKGKKNSKVTDGNSYFLKREKYQELESELEKAVEKQKG